jgi:hypothetical protein
MEGEKVLPKKDKSLYGKKKKGKVLCIKINQKKALCP